MKIIKRLDITSYVEDQTVSITIGPGSDTDVVENIPKLPDTALEIEGDDGNIYVVLAYKRKV